MDHEAAVSRSFPSDASPDEAIVEERKAVVQPEQPNSDLVEALLAALIDMAVRSARRQADLEVALRRSGIQAPASTVRRALDCLVQDGCIEHLVPLADGGLLMQVTARGIERLSQTSRRHILDFTAR